MTGSGAARGDRASYAQAGVDIAAGERAVDLIRSAVARTAGPEVVGGIGGFAGLFDASKLTSYRRPLLATATDGVGTKVVIARQLGVYDTIGIDLVGMVVDDLVVCGAEPLFLTDYVVCGQVRPERVAAIVAGRRRRVRNGRAALLSVGRRPSIPGTWTPMILTWRVPRPGSSRRTGCSGRDRVRAGDAIIAMASSGLHSNGFSLVRHVIATQAGLGLERRRPSSGGRSARSC